MPDGGPALTEASVRGLLIAALVIGLVLRVVGWNHGHPGAVAWIGGILMLFGIAGLIMLQFMVERARMTRPSFYFNPNWKYGLLLLCIVTLSVQGLVKPAGAIATLNVALFWAALITLVVQTVGRWIQRRRGVGQSKPTHSIP